MTISLRHGPLITLLGAFLALLPACRQLNADHCANLSGGATCAAIDPERPHCSVCFDPGGANGCTAQIPTDECRYDGDIADGSSTAEPPGDSGDTDLPPGGTDTSATATTTNEGTTSPVADTGEGTTASGDTSMGSSSDGPSSDGPSSDGPSSDGGEACGNGVIDPGEGCDGSEFSTGPLCSDISGNPMMSGTADCTDECQIDTSTCCLLAGAPCNGNGDCCSNDCTGLPPVVGECN